MSWFNKGFENYISIVPHVLQWDISALLSCHKNKQRVKNIGENYVFFEANGVNMIFAPFDISVADASGDFPANTATCEFDDQSVRQNKTPSKTGEKRSMNEYLKINTMGKCFLNYDEGKLIKTLKFK